MQVGEKPTIVRRLINGFGSVPGIPIVWGISATVERFNTAMSDMQGRTTLPKVAVDSRKVQASGLLKDIIVRRGKVPSPSGCEPRPATVAPAGSNRSG